MEETLEIRGRTTAAIIFQLLADDEAIDLTLYNVTLYMQDKQKKTYVYATTDDDPALEFVTPKTDGKLTFTPPDDTVFLTRSSPYYVYCVITSTVDGTSFAIPGESEAKINVRESFAK